MDPYGYDDSFRNKGRVAGLDEAGRGPLAGPVVAAAVVLPPGLRFDGLRDSKKLSPKQREILAPQIITHCLDLGLGVAPAEIVDKINVLQATRRAMASAVADLAEPPSFLLIDAVVLSDVPIAQQSMYKGEDVSASIAAASVLAKVVRDAMMRQYDAMYPGYGFASHKGYGTRSHLEAIRRLGPSPVHRMTFAGVKTLGLPL